MSDENSLRIARDFRRRIDNLDARENELFLRGFLTGAVDKCPIDILKRLGECLLECRLHELADEASGN